MRINDEIKKLRERVARLEELAGVDPSFIESPDAANDGESRWPTPPPRRLSRVYLKAGTKRPAVMSLQEMLGLEVDGIFGESTRAAVVTFQQANQLTPDGVVGPKTWAALFKSSIKSSLFCRVYEWVSWVETGERQDAFGFAESDIGDGAGANYGVIQFNSRGSLERLLKSSGRDDLLNLYQSHDRDSVVSEIRDWMGSPDGIRAQADDFRASIFGPALKDYLEVFVPGSCGMVSLQGERLVCLLADFRVQNGSLYSPYRGPYRSIFTENWGRVMPMYLGDQVSEEVAELTLAAFDESAHGDYADRNRVAITAMVAAIPQGEHYEEALAAALAVYRGSCSRLKYAQRVVDRKLAIATGGGRVHGADVNMRGDFGVG